jgi:hypothetical protein
MDHERQRDPLVLVVVVEFAADAGLEVAVSAVVGGDRFDVGVDPLAI